MIVAMLTIMWDWFLSSNPAQIISALAAIGGLYRVSSNREHRATLAHVKRISRRLGRLEKAVGVELDEVDE